jgi:hypothetical protein
MEVNGKLHASAALRPKKEFLVPDEKLIGQQSRS